MSLRVISSLAPNSEKEVIIVARESGLGVVSSPVGEPRDFSHGFARDQRAVGALAATIRMRVGEPVAVSSHHGEPLVAKQQQRAIQCEPALLHRDQTLCG